MADPIDFPEATHTLGRPANMTDAQCGGLRVAIGEREGLPVRISCWKLSMTELENVIKTGNVFLLVWGDFHPPVSITGERPFDNESEPMKPRWKHLCDECTLIAQTETTDIYQDSAYPPVFAFRFGEGKRNTIEVSCEDVAAALLNKKPS